MTLKSNRNKLYLSLFLWCNEILNIQGVWSPLQGAIYRAFLKHRGGLTYRDTHVPWCFCHMSLWIASVCQPCCQGPTTFPSAISWWVFSSGNLSPPWLRRSHPILAVHKSKIITINPDTLHIRVFQSPVWVSRKHQRIWPATATTFSAGFSTKSPVSVVDWFSENKNSKNLINQALNCYFKI